MLDFLTVDAERCHGDGACVDECPAYLLSIPDGESMPVAIEGAERFCIECGHCVAVCPTEALSLHNLRPVECPPVVRGALPSSDQVEHLLRARRSVRTFERQPVEHERLERLIDIARCAPTGGNRQPVEWLVVEDPKRVQALALIVEEWMRHEQPHRMASLARAAHHEKDMMCRGAPCVVLAHTKPGSETDGVIALTYLELAADSLGLGACWGGFFNSAIRAWPPMREAIGLPDDRSPCGAMLLGYPTHAFCRIPPRRPVRIAWQ